MIRSRRAIFIGVMLAACTGKSPDPLPKYPDASAYCSGRAQAECNDAVIAACALPSKEKCVAQRKTACSATVPGGKSYDASKAEACIDRVGAAYGDAKLTKDEIKSYSEACTLLFGGTGGRDATCTVDADCKLGEGLRCVRAGGASDDGGAASGTCQVPKPANGGDSCAALDVMCAAGYHCGANKHCDINSDLGENCSGAVPCKEGLKCSPAGKCEQKLSDGSPCTTSEECTNGICLEQTNICVSQVTFAPNEPFCVQAR